MDALEIYKGLATDPDFSKLAYADQVAVRGELMNAIAQSDPEFQALQPQDQEEAFKRAVYRPPTLKDPKMSGEFAAMVNAADAGDETAKQQYNSLYATLDTGLNGGLIYALADKAVGAIQRAFFDAGVDISGPALGGAETNPLTRMSGTDDAVSTFQFMNSRKQLGMLDHVSGSDFARGVANFGNASVDFSTLGAGFSALNAGIATMPVVQGLLNGGKIARMTGNILIPLTAESIVGGVVGVGTQKLASMVENNSDIDPMKTFDALALNFGFGAAMNFVVGGVFRSPLLRMIGSGFKSVFGNKDLAALNTNAVVPDEATLAKMIDDISTSRTAAESIRAQLSPYQQAVQVYRDTIQDLRSKSASDFSEADSLIYSVYQTSRDMVVNPSPKGGFDMFYIKPKEGAHLVTELEYTHAPTLIEAYDVAGEHIARITKMNTASGLPENAAIQRYGDWLLKWNETKLGATIGAETAQKSIVPGRIGIGDRPMIGVDELALIQPDSGVTPIRVRAGFEPEMVARLQNHQQALSYDDMRMMTADASAPNAVILAKNILDVSESIMKEEGLGSIVAARTKGYDTLRIMADDGTIMGYASLVPGNLKILASEVSAQGKMMSSKVSGEAKTALSVGAMEGNIRGTVHETLEAAHVADNEGLLVRHVMSITDDVIEPQAVKAYAKMLTGNSAVHTDVKLTASKEVSVKFENGVLQIEVPNVKLVGQERITFAKELTEKLRGSGALRALPTGPQRVMRDLQAVQNKGPDAIAKTFLMDKTNGVWSSKFLGDVLKKELNTTLQQLPDGSYSIVLAGKTVSGSLTEIWMAAKPYLASPKGIKDALAQQGIKLLNRKGELWAKTADGQEFQFNSYAEAAEHFGVSTALLPSQYRPSFVELDPNSAGITVYSESAGIRMSKADALELLNSFANDAPVEKVIVAKAGDGFATYLKQDSTVSFIDSRSKTKLLFKNFE